MLGALVSGGLSLLGGLGSRQSAKKQQKIQAAYEYQNMVQTGIDNEINRVRIEQANATARHYQNLMNEQGRARIDFLNYHGQARQDMLNKYGAARQDYINAALDEAAGVYDAAGKRGAAAYDALAAEVVGRWDRKDMVRDAEAMGFNPVTWLNAMSTSYAAMEQYGRGLSAAGIDMSYNASIGGAQYRAQKDKFVPEYFVPEMYTDSYSADPYMYTQKSYMQNAPSAQVPSMLEVVGTAAQTGWNAYASDRRVAQSQDFQREMLATQLSAIQRRNSAAPNGVVAQSFFGSGQIPYSVTAGAQSVGRSPNGVTLPLGLSNWKPGDVEVTNPFSGGAKVEPTVADAQTFTQRYGESEVLETGVAAWLMMNDLSRNYFGRPVDGAAKQGWRTLFGYTDYPDGARGLSWGLPDKSWNPGQLPGFDFRTGEQF